MLSIGWIDESRIRRVKGAFFEEFQLLEVRFARNRHPDSRTVQTPKYLDNESLHNGGSTVLRKLSPPPYSLFFFFLCFPFLSRPFKFVSGGLNLLKLDSYSYTFNTRILACACIEQFSSLRFERKCALLKRSKRSRCSTVVFFIPFPFLRFLPLNVERFTTDEKIIGENNRGVETVNYVN